MAPDLDILIQSTEDPLIYLEYHRQFTHSLIFIPIGALICASLMWLFLKSKLSFKTIYLLSLFGYGSHGLLDSSTSYGTQLFWPFTNYRVAWNNISIIDPIWTFPTLALIILAAVKKKPLFARMGLIWAIGYLLFGGLQSYRARAVGHEIAETRGHTPIHLSAKPSFGNLLLFKVVYETEDRYYVDAIRVGLEKRIFEGESIEKLDIEKKLSQPAQRLSCLQ